MTGQTFDWSFSALYIAEGNFKREHMEQRQLNADRKSGGQLQTDEVLEASEMCIARRHQIDDRNHLLLQFTRSVQAALRPAG